MGQAAKSKTPATSEPGAEALRVSFGFGELAPAHVLAYPLIASDTAVGVVPTASPST